MRNPLRFFVEVMRQPAWIAIWVLVLMLVNMASIAWWSQPLAKVIFTTFMISAVLMMVLYSRFGFSKILGLGHALWIPLLIYVVFQIPYAGGWFRTYLIVFSVFTVVSLAFDITDVWQFYKDRMRAWNALRNRRRTPAS